MKAINGCMGYDKPMSSRLAVHASHGYTTISLHAEVLQKYNCCDADVIYLCHATVPLEQSNLKALR